MVCVELSGPHILISSGAPCWLLLAGLTTLSGEAGRPPNCRPKYPSTEYRRAVEIWRHSHSRPDSADFRDSKRQVRARPIWSSTDGG